MIPRAARHARSRSAQTERVSRSHGGPRNPASYSRAPVERSDTKLTRCAVPGGFPRALEDLRIDVRVRHGGALAAYAWSLYPPGRLHGELEGVELRSELRHSASRSCSCSFPHSSLSSPLANRYAANQLQPHRLYMWREIPVWGYCQGHFALLRREAGQDRAGAQRPRAVERPRSSPRVRAQSTPAP
jgi:hypothetical protein